MVTSKFHSESAKYFRRLIEGSWQGLREGTLGQVVKFYEAVVQENERQNLTRLTSPEAFFEGHCQDVRALEELRWKDYPAVDLGSGVGVPGLLSAIIDGQEWILVESELRKAAFLSETARALDLSKVRVLPGRIEEVLKNTECKTIVARAVGPVDRIYGWIRSCSTWNNLILFKGPAWEQEWSDFVRGRYKNELVIRRLHSYEVGKENKKRTLVQLSRVPRGTNCLVNG